MILSLLLSYDCNMECGYCYQKQQDKYLSHMDLDLSKKIISKFIKKEDYNIHIEFLGGEPLLKKKLIEEIITYCTNTFKNKKITYSLITNGVLLDQKFIIYSMNHNLNISLSFDGVEIAHNMYRKLRNNIDSWKIVKEKLEFLVKYSPNAPILLTLNPKTVPFLFDSIKYIYSKKVKKINISLNYQKKWAKNDFILLEKELYKIAELYLEKYDNNEEFSFIPFDGKIQAYINKNLSKGRCSLDIDNITIAPDGSIFPCIAFIEKDMTYCIGSIYDGIDFKKLRNFKKESIKDTNKLNCQHCEFRDRCFNWCSCANYLGTQQLNQIPDALCQYEKIIIPIADNVATKLFETQNKTFINKFYK